MGPEAIIETTLYVALLTIFNGWVVYEVLALRRRDRKRRKAMQQAYFDALLRGQSQTNPWGPNGYGSLHRQPNQLVTPAWCKVLGIPRHATKEQINMAYRVKAMSAHPDKGGSTEAMTALNKARREALATNDR